MARLRSATARLRKQNHAAAAPSQVFSNPSLLIRLIFEYLSIFDLGCFAKVSKGCYEAVSAKLRILPKGLSGQGLHINPPIRLNIRRGLAKSALINSKVTAKRLVFNSTELSQSNLTWMSPYVSEINFSSTAPFSALAEMRNAEFPRLNSLTLRHTSEYPLFCQLFTRNHADSLQHLCLRNITIRGGTTLAKDRFM